MTGCGGKASSAGVVGDVLLFPGKVPLCPPRIVFELQCCDRFSFSDRFISMGLAERRMLHDCHREVGSAAGCRWTQSSRFGRKI